MTRQPPYSITPDMLCRGVQIGEATGRTEASGGAWDLRVQHITRIGTLRNVQEAWNAIPARDRYERGMLPARWTYWPRTRSWMSALVDRPRTGSHGT